MTLLEPSLEFNRILFENAPSVNTKLFIKQKTSDIDFIWNIDNIVNYNNIIILIIFVI